jgi:AraC-like DNA-binding protein
VGKGTTLRYARSPGFEEISGSAREQCDLHDQWLGFIQRHVLGYDLLSGAANDRDFSINAWSRAADEWAVSRFSTIAGKSQLIRRAREIARDPRERYVAYFSLNNTLEFEQLRRTNVCAADSLTLVSGAEPLLHNKLGDNDTLCFAMPREFVDQRLIRAEDVCARPVPVQRGLGRLVRSSLMALQRDADAMTEDEFCRAARVVGDLVLMVVGGQGDLMSNVRSVRTSNLARIKRVIRERLSDPDLRLADIAHACGISLSYMHNLFRDDGRTAWEYLKMERLQLARHMLQTTGRQARTVTDVALDCGFSNMSQFSTAFRAAFGVPPRDVLRQG